MVLLQRLHGVVYLSAELVALFDDGHVVAAALEHLGGLYAARSAADYDDLLDLLCRRQIKVALAGHGAVAGAVAVRAGGKLVRGADIAADAGVYLPVAALL